MYESMDFPRLSQLSRDQLALPPDSRFQLSLIEKGGSGRIYARLEAAAPIFPDAASSLILMLYGADRPDNARFLSSTKLLQQLKVPVPKVYAETEPSADLDGMAALWMEDLGAVDLLELSTKSWESVVLPAYESAFRAVLPLHLCCDGDFSLEPPFDESLYLWEQEYFQEHFVSRFSSNESTQCFLAKGGVKKVASVLSVHPRCLTTKALMLCFVKMVAPP